MSHVEERMRKFSAVLIIALAAMPLRATAQTDAPETEVSVLRGEVERLTELVRALRDEVAALGEGDGGAGSSSLTVPELPIETAPPFELSGDFRYRYEVIDAQDVDTRERQRFRARIRAARDFGDSFTVGLGFASGGDSPTSGTQSFDEGASSKEVDIDQAWLRWRTPIDGLSLTAGKMQNPFRRAGGYGLLWDSELFPEGAALDYRYPRGFLTVGEFLLDERPSAEDAWLLGLQAGHALNLSHAATLTLGAGYFDYRGVQGRVPLYDPESSAGNTLDELGQYAYDYDELEFYAELSLLWSDLDIRLFGDYVRNLRADRHDDGYAAGLRVGGRRDARWQLGYVYQDLASDAVLGVFTGSDFGGGGTGKRGHHMMLGYALREDLITNLTWYANERDDERGRAENYQRVQADINYRW